MRERRCRRDPGVVHEDGHRFAERVLRGGREVACLGRVTEVGSDELNRELEKGGAGSLERDRLDSVLTGAPTQVTEAEGTLKPEVRDEFRKGAAEGISRGFAAVLLALGAFAVASIPLWLLLMRPARAP